MKLEVKLSGRLRMTKQRKGLVQACAFYLELLPDLAQYDGTLVLRFSRLLTKKTTHYAQCGFIKGKRTCVVTFDVHTPKHIAVQTIAHEIVHAKQYVTGELSHTRAGNLTWKGKKPAKDVPYHRLPWEQEAHELEIFLAHEYWYAVTIE